MALARLPQLENLPKCLNANEKTATKASDNCSPNCDRNSRATQSVASRELNQILHQLETHNPRDNLGASLPKSLDGPPSSSPVISAGDLPMDVRCTLYRLDKLAVGTCNMHWLDIYPYYAHYAALNYRYTSRLHESIQTMSANKLLD